MKIFILDDETHARESIKSYLAKYFQRTYSVMEADSIDEGLQMIQERSPDLAFLDIHLGNGTSFDMLAQLDEITFKIIFISGHDEYAVKAFRFNAIDYILKPIDPREFQEAVGKIQDISPLKEDHLDKLNGDIQSGTIDKIVLKDIHSIYFVEISQIIFCESENNYTSFYLRDKSVITVSKTLKEYETILKPLGFFRPHRSFLINMNLIKSFDKKEGGSINMEDGTQVPIARNKRETFMHLMNIR
ncbi:MAG: LytTR family DNA-binding domain-containing protein [Bacteroidota bacterium]